MTKSQQNFKFSDISKSFITIENIVKHFDDFDQYLDTFDTRFGMMYIKKDMPGAFDSKSVTSCRRRIRTDKSSKKYIPDTVREIENNMNWTGNTFP